MQRRNTKIQHRGNYLDLGQAGDRRHSGRVPAAAAGARPDRLALASGSSMPENPLTAGVIANRFWEQIFGIGIVATSEDFGSAGRLAVSSRNCSIGWRWSSSSSKWNLKAFLKLLVTSAAYQQSSKVTPEMEQRDPDNRLLARGPRFRLSAEMVRDQALSVSGLLSAKMYGPPVNPPQPAIGLRAAFGSEIDWQSQPGRGSLSPRHFTRCGGARTPIRRWRRSTLPTGKFALSAGCAPIRRCRRW